MISDFAGTVLVHNDIKGHIVTATVAAGDAVDIDVVDVVVVGVIIAIVIVPDSVDNNIFQTDIPMANSACFSAIL